MSDSTTGNSLPGQGAAAPLADLRVVAVEQFGAGPFGTLQLADLGAEVIKVEDPAAGGDVSRQMPPYRVGEDSLFFESFNRNKKSISLDLRHPGGRQAFEDLVRHADVVFSNLRGDGPEKLGLTYADLRSANPTIVCCSLSGFGMTGPRRTDGAYDYVVQGLAGWMSLTGGPDEPPMKSGLSLVDLAGGYVAAISMMAAVWRARRDGVGADVDLSLFETALSLLTYVGTWAASRGYEPERLANSAHPSIVPFQVFATADGWLVIACAKEKFWTRLTEVVGRPELAGDPRFATFAERRENRQRVQAEIGAELVKRSTDAWVAELRAVGVPAAPVNDVAGALDDPQVHARGGISEVEHETLGVVRHLSSPLRLGDGAPIAPGPGPRRGEHTEELLVGLCGYDPGQVAQLAADGALTLPSRPRDPRRRRAHHLVVVGSDARSESRPAVAGSPLRRTPRSLLFAPGDDPRKLAKALTAGAGLVVADLEDAVAEPSKGQARATVAKLLADRDASRGRCAVRINGLDGPHAEQDLAMATRGAADAIVVPKARHQSLNDLAGRGLPPIIAIIETAAGLQESDAIARTEGVLALLLGAVDLGVELRWEPRGDRLQLLFARSKLVMDSAAAGIAAPIDVVHTDVQATDALAQECTFARSLGFGGKACIHPRQVAVVEVAFAPTADQAERARRVVDAYEAAERTGLGVCTVDGEMVDLPVYRRAREIVNETGDGR